MYDVTTDERSQPQIDALPIDGLAPFAEVRAALEVAPWSTGESLNDEYLEAPVRSVVFGAEGQGMVTSSSSSSNDSVESMYSMSRGWADTPAARWLGARISGGGFELWAIRATTGRPGSCR
jgi:hypothetical protein